jgi:AraC-like DNA-binding protein
LSRVTKYDLPIDEDHPIHGIHSQHRRAATLGRDMHFGLELGVLLSGKMVRFYPGLRRTLGPGDVWFCGMWEPHGFRVVQAPCECVVLVMLPQLLSRSAFPEAAELDWLSPFTVPPRDRPQSRPSDRKRLIALGRRITDAVDRNGPEEGLRLRLLAYELLLPFVSRTGSARAATERDAFDSGGIQRAVELAMKSTAPISIPKAALLCGLGRKTFERRFQSLMGLTFAKFALRCRLASAAQELRETGAPLKAISERWGFTDASHFHHRFVEDYGETPRKYRLRYGAS